MGIPPTSVDTQASETALVDQPGPTSRTETHLFMVALNLFCAVQSHNQLSAPYITFPHPVKTCIYIL